MRNFAAVILVCITCGVTGQIWTPHSATAVWECRNKQVNTTIPGDTIMSSSLLGCAHHCANTATSTGVKIVSLYFDAADHRCYCNSDVDVDGDADVAVDVADVETDGGATVGEDAHLEIRNCQLKMSLKIDKTANQKTRSSFWPHLQDCLDLHKVRNTREDVHVIYPGGQGPVDAACDVRGTLIQRRFGGATNFNRSWSEYVNGFGDTTGDYWLGLKYLHHLTKLSMLLVIELEPFNLKDFSPGWGPYLTYYRFSVGNESSKYVFQHRGVANGHHLSQFHIRDLFRGQNELRFSTFDNDNNEYSDGNLAAETQSGWWFGNLPYQNPNSPCANIRKNGSSVRQLFSWPTCDGSDDLNVVKTTMTLYRYYGSLSSVGPPYCIGSICNCY